MNDRLLVGVLGNPDSGKSHTWYKLFLGSVRTSKKPRDLKLFPGECVEVFLINGSPEERGLSVETLLNNQIPQIILCSLRYTEEDRKALHYFIEQDFDLYIQWLNPGCNDHNNDPIWDKLGIVSEILSAPSIFAIRDGKADADFRVQEIREIIYGWAKTRNLLKICKAEPSAGDD